MITTEPNQTVVEYQDRMPVVIELADVELWMADDTPQDHLKSLLAPCPEDWLLTEDAGPIETGKRKITSPESGQESLF